jgi:hypothetical protein
MYAPVEFLLSCHVASALQYLWLQPHSGSAWLLGFALMFWWCCWLVAGRHHGSQLVTGCLSVMRCKFAVGQRSARELDARHAKWH